MQLALEIEHLNYKYEDSSSLVLDDINIKIPRGEWSCILGKNGSGKSTLIKLIAGLRQSKESANIKVFGIPLQAENLPAIRRKLGIVFQNPNNQFVGNTVFEDIAFGLKYRGFTREQIKQQVMALLAQMDMLPLSNLAPHNLSGGQKQKLALAGVIAVKPELIILDEASSMLDPMAKQEFLAMVATLKQQFNLSILTITHDIYEAEQADNIIILNQGKIVTQGKMQDILMQDQLLKDNGLDIPFVRKIQQYITNTTIKLPKHYLNEQTLVELLCKSVVKM